MLAYMRSLAEGRPDMSSARGLRHYIGNGGAGQRKPASLVCTQGSATPLANAWYANAAEQPLYSSTHTRRGTGEGAERSGAWRQL